jgi:MoaA/NifB/PqqE/SkfB family radical SAM enzyme
MSLQNLNPTFRVESRWAEHKDTIKVEWNLGKRCNYNCSYCPSSIHDSTSPHTDINILKATVDKLTELNKPVRLSLTGGEPCVHPDIEELIAYIKSKNIWLSITTNGTRKATWYVSQPVDQYVFSLHFEHEWGHVLTTIERTSDLIKDTKIVVHVMAHQEMMKEVRAVANALETRNIAYNIRRVRWTEGDADLFDDMKYDQSDLDWILSKTSTVKPNTLVFSVVDDKREMKVLHANDVIKLHLNKFNGWDCNAGLESLMINWDGEVHRATCRVGGTLGNVYSGSFTIPTEPINCTRNFCTCAADIPLTKYDRNNSDPQSK